MSIIMKKKKYKVIIILLFLFVLLVFMSRSINKSNDSFRYVGKEYYEEHDSSLSIYGYVPTPFVYRRPRVADENVAEEVGTTILGSIYGKRILEKQKPFKVSLVNDKIWIIEGKLSINKSFFIAIQQSDCRVLKISGYTYMEYLKNQLCGGRNFNNTSSEYVYNNLMLKKSISIDTIRNIKIYKVHNNEYVPDSSVYGLSDGVLKDYETAAKVGIILLSSYFGKEHIISEYPFKVSLYNNKLWRLCGSLPPNFTFGGTANIVIQKSDCRIINCFHEK